VYEGSDFMEYWAIWLVIVILLAIIEAGTVNLVSVWFIVSGIVSLLVSLVSDSFFLQFGIFVILGIILMILTRPMLNKMIQNKNEKTNLERIIGMEGIVTQKISKNKIGEVKVDGKLWSAISDKTINVDSIVKVNSMESVKLVVEEVKPEVEIEEEKTESVVVEEKPKTTKKTTAPKKKSSNTTKTNSTAKKKTTNNKKKKTNTNKKVS